MALSTNRTLITQTGINTHQVLNVGGLDSAGIATFSNFKTGFSNVHSIGFDVGSAATIRSTGNASFTGVVTAATFSGSFTGDGQNLTGLPAGLGTALSNTQTDALNKIYFTNRVLSISTTTTVDPPATASAAYTQYTDIAISNGSDLIIKDGDELVPDVLGLSTSALPVTNLEPNIGGRLRVSQITNTNANGAPNFPNGLTVTGIVTASTLNTSTNQIVVGSAVTANITGIDVTGVVTATSYRGDGSQLTGIDASTLKNGSDIKVQANASGAVVTGILTTTQFKPGEIIETLTGVCDGRTINVQSGSYTLQNVTSKFQETDNYQDITGSILAYTPPSGTKTLVYGFKYKWSSFNNSGISFMKMFVDSTEIIPARTQVAGGHQASNHSAWFVDMRFVFDLSVGTEDAANGKFIGSNWTSNKTFKIQTRRYNSTYTSEIHGNDYWRTESLTAGTSATGTDEYVKPILYIQAIA